MMDFGALAAFHFLRPWWLLTLIPLGAAVWQLRKVRERGEQWQQNIAPHLLKALTVGGEHTRWFSPINVSALAIVLAVVALAGPSWERKALPYVQDEAPFVIVLSLTESMNQQDIQPSRLERAQQKIRDLLEIRPGTKTAIVVYAGTAHVVVPLTTDPELVFQFLSALNTDMMPRTGSNPERAIPFVERIVGQEAPSGTILLITDSISSYAPSAFAEYFSKRSDQLIVYGVGTENGALRGGEASNDTTSLPLDRNALELLSETVGGKYVQVSVDKTDVRQISAAIEQHLATVEDENRPWVDAGYYLLFPFALIFVLWFRKGWTLSWCLLIVLVFSVQSPSLQAADDAGSGRPPAEVGEGSPEDGVSDTGELSIVARLWSDFLSLWFTGDQLGAIYFRLGAFDKAAVHFEDTQWKAAAYYYNESFKNAIQLYSGIDSTDSMFNLGNAYAQNQEYVKALETYRKLLEMDPAYQSAEKNIEIIQALVDEINQMSASQQPEPGEDIGELGDEPQTADGAEREDVPQVERKQFNAEQILSDERIQEQWMRQVQKDPSRFLRVKFQMQLDEQAGAQ